MPTSLNVRRTRDLSEWRAASIAIVMAIVVTGLAWGMSASGSVLTQWDAAKSCSDPSASLALLRLEGRV